MGKLKEETRTSEIASAATIAERVLHSLDNSTQSAEAWQELKSIIIRSRCCAFRYVNLFAGFRQMNVLMVSRGVFPLPPCSSGGGAERHAYELALALVHRGHNVHLVTPISLPKPSIQGLELSTTTLHGGFIHPNVPFYGWLFKHAIASAATFQAATRILRDVSAHYDIVHVHGNMNALLLSHLPGSIPLVYSVHDAPPSIMQYQRIDETFVREAVFRTIDIPALKKVDHILTVNPAIKHSLTTFGIKPEKISIVPNGTHTITRPHSPRGDLGIFVGQLVRRKGAHILLEALSRIPNIRILIVGDGPEKAHLLRLAKQLNCDDRVTFSGYVTASELDEIYDEASFGVFPTLADAMPTLALLECMAHGLPPIVSRVPGADWVIHQGENGFLFETGNVEDLRRQLVALSSDSQLRDRTGANARQHVEREFTWDTVARGVEGAYQRAIQQTRISAKS